MLQSHFPKHSHYNSKHFNGCLQVFPLHRIIDLYDGNKEQPEMKGNNKDKQNP